MIEKAWFKYMKNRKSQPALNVISRSIAAIFGGYVLSNLCAILLSYLLPLTTLDSVLLSLQLSFLFYSIIIVYVFSVKTACSAWRGLIIACFISILGLYFSKPEGLL